jgi:hypothetical protein
VRPDIAVSNSAGHPILTVEVKARRGRDTDWAMQLWRNLRAHGLEPISKYFLLVTPDQTFLWRENPNDLAALHNPDVIVPTGDILGNLFGDLDATPRSVDEAALEHLVASWLARIVHAPSVEDLPPESRRFAEETGLYEALRGGDVKLQVA